MAVKVKRVAAKGGLKFGKRKAVRSRAGTAVLFGRALVGNEEARGDLRDAVASGRKAYARGSDRRGRPDVSAFLEDRKARKEARSAATSLRDAIRVARRTREKPKSSKGPALAVAAAAGAATVVAVKARRGQAGGASASHA